MPDEILEEAVLSSLGRPRIRLDAEHLFAHERREQRLELVLRQSDERRDSPHAERLAEHRPVLKKPALRGREAVEPRGDQRVQRLRNLERRDLLGRPVRRAFLCEQTAIEQHAHGFHRVQRHAFGALEDLPPQALGQAGHEPLEQLLHGAFGKRLEVERREVAVARSPTRPPLVQLGPRERDHVEREIARPLEQVLDEVEQARVRPVHVLEREHGGVHLGEPLEEQPPGREQILPVADGRFLEPEEVREPWLDERPLVLVGHVLIDARPELAPCRGGILVLADAGAHAHHVRERPVRHAFAVGQAAAAVPVHLLDEPVEVLVELPGHARLADPGDSRHGDEVCAPVLCAGVEQILDQLQLALATDERRLEPGRLQRAADAGHDTQGLPEDHELGLPFQLVLARALEDDRLLGRPPRRLTNQHRAGIRSRLDA